MYLRKKSRPNLERNLVRSGLTTIFVTSYAYYFAIGSKSIDKLKKVVLQWKKYTMGILIHPKS